MQRRENLKAANKAGSQGDERSEQQSAVAALNYGVRARFIRIPSPRCSLSGGIKEEDIQSGFSLRPHWQHTQKTALAAAKGDSGGDGGGEERGMRGMKMR